MQLLHQGECATHARAARAVQGRGDCSVVVVRTSEVDAASLHSELSAHVSRLHNAKIQIELTVLFSVISGGFGGPIEGTKANFPLTLMVL